ncbi:hypothetical protein IWW36_003965 [Coemansia brasiliensis]|uniref:Uncharacterized protein n=1 Tax=Coemansia brasiliensis TaxID=2650707 RepID=A0A9W8LYF9_9FUNG|nr:hypothetical protein IWW36_003965 [Coemansia brasiliensis]
METCPAKECKNKRCLRIYWNSSSESVFCSSQCAYAHALESYRKTSSAYSTPTSLSSLGDWPIRLGKCHTLTLIRCGIDPWAPSPEIQMRQHFCHRLTAALANFSACAKLADYAWPLENLNFIFSHLPEYEALWSDTCHKNSSYAERYEFLGSLLIYQLGKTPSMVCALLGDFIHPAEFFIALFNR